MRLSDILNAIMGLSLSSNDKLQLAKAIFESGGANLSPEQLEKINGVPTDQEIEDLATTAAEAFAAGNFIPLSASDFYADQTGAKIKKDSEPIEDSPNAITSAAIFNMIQQRDGIIENLVARLNGVETGNPFYTPGEVTFIADDEANTLAVTPPVGGPEELTTADIEISIEGAAPVPYTGIINIGPIGRVEGYIRGRVSGGNDLGRNAGPWSDSPAFLQDPPNERRVLIDLVGAESTNGINTSSFLDNVWNTAQMSAINSLTWFDNPLDTTGLTVQGLKMTCDRTVSNNSIGATQDIEDYPLSAVRDQIVISGAVSETNNLFIWTLEIPDGWKVDIFKAWGSFFSGSNSRSMSYKVVGDAVYKSFSPKNNLTYNNAAILNDLTGTVQIEWGAIWAMNVSTGFNIIDIRLSKIVDNG